MGCLQQAYVIVHLDNRHTDKVSMLRNMSVNEEVKLYLWAESKKDKPATQAG
jgi:hypothetical protein